MDQDNETPKSITDLCFEGRQIQVASQLDERSVNNLFNVAFATNQKKITIPTLGNPINIILSKIIFYAVAEITPEILNQMQKQQRGDPAIVPVKTGIVSPDGRTLNVSKPKLQ